MKKPRLTQPGLFLRMFSPVQKTCFPYLLSLKRGFPTRLGLNKMRLARRGISEPAR